MSTAKSTPPVGVPPINYGTFLATLMTNFERLAKKEADWDNAPLHDRFVDYSNDPRCDEFAKDFVIETSSVREEGPTGPYAR